MNLILLLILWGDSFAIVYSFIFSMAHAVLSGLMFYLVDCVYKRFHSRSVFSVNGVLNTCPNLGTAIIGMLLLFSGLPGTIKFCCEYLTFCTIASSSIPAFVLLIVTMNGIGLVGFSKPWLNAIFGMPKRGAEAVLVDLGRKEALLILLCFFLFIDRKSVV